jgi:hypothetical protein
MQEITEHSESTANTEQFQGRTCRCGVSRGRIRQWLFRVSFPVHAAPAFACTVSSAVSVSEQ